MSFGRNPHVAKAEAAELKAQEARDALAHEQAWREAAHQWERAAAREKNDKLRRSYAEKADLARTNADAGVGAPGERDEGAAPESEARAGKLLN